MDGIGNAASTLYPATFVYTETSDIFCIATTRWRVFAPHGYQMGLALASIARLVFALPETDQRISRSSPLTGFRAANGSENGQTVLFSVVCGAKAKWPGGLSRLQRARVGNVESGMFVVVRRSSSPVASLAPV